MGIWSGTKKVASHLVNVRVDKWVGYNELKNTSNYILFIMTSLIKPKQTKVKESFEEATQRLQLSTDDVARQAIQFQRWTVIFIGLALGLLGYAVYLFQQGNIMGMIMTLALMLYASYQAFHFNFWLYQMKEQRLGCTFKEWLFDTFRKNA